MKSFSFPYYCSVRGRPLVFHNVMVLSVQVLDFSDEDDKPPLISLVLIMRLLSLCS